MWSGLPRRLFLKILGAAGLLATAKATTGCAAEADGQTGEDDATLADYDYVIVGSGAGGAPLAANLARHGKRVLLLEAGDDQGETETYQVPGFHAQSTEFDPMRWDYFVKHYGDERRARTDTKFTWQAPDGSLHVGANAPDGSKPLGVWYPRAGTLGGCTSHNAMITVYPHESDWKKIADLTGDASWRPENMRRYYEILERCEYLAPNASTRGHGFKGWLGVSRPDSRLALRDPKIVTIVKAAAAVAGHGLFGDLAQLLGLMNRDLNEAGPERDAREGVHQIPLAVSKGKRSGPRDYLLATERAKNPDGSKKYPLDIRTGCLVTRVLFDDETTADGKARAIGVEFMQGKHLYRADPNAGGAGGGAGERHRALVRRGKGEVILSAGAFNTPQLLKLSGIGPRAELENERLRIPVRVALPGVGTNLQDRYEVGIVSRLRSDFAIEEPCTFGAPNDPCLAEWRSGTGPYTSNGTVVTVIKRSSVAEQDPDLFVFGAPGNFTGYHPGYSRKVTEDKRHFTWAVLKGHTRNRAGTVTLRSTDPRDTPDIDFKYFDDGTTTGAAHERDLQAMAEGVELARAIAQKTGSLLLFEDFDEEFPGPSYATPDRIKEFVKNEAWGHHASCSCPIGADGDPMAVLDSRFRVRGTVGLRVVDASVFPYIPGFFIVVPIYMISEKATDVLLEDVGEKRKT